MTVHRLDSADSHDLGRLSVCARTEVIRIAGGTGRGRRCTAAPGPLDGLLVADFSRILAGPYATMLLADLGADVIKVEGPAGDDTRSWVPPVRDGVSTYYLGVQPRQALDRAGPARRDRRRAGPRAGPARRRVIENFKPGGLTKYGLDYDVRPPDQPGVVYSSISGFGAGAGRRRARLRPDGAGDLAA